MTKCPWVRSRSRMARRSAWESRLKATCRRSGKLPSTTPSGRSPRRWRRRSASRRHGRTCWRRCQAMIIFLTVTARFPANGHIIVREGALGGERLDYIFTHYLAPNLEPWRALLGQARREGKVREDLDIRTLFFLLTDGGAGPYTSQALAKRIGGPDPLRPEAVRAHAELVADLLLRGIVTAREGTTGVRS